jgi:hypothetical protein
MYSKFSDALNVNGKPLVVVSSISVFFMPIYHENLVSCGYDVAGVIRC